MFYVTKKCLSFQTFTPGKIHCAALKLPFTSLQPFKQNQKKTLKNLIAMDTGMLNMDNLRLEQCETPKGHIGRPSAQIKPKEV